MNPEILYEDNHLIAVNKPIGVLVQGDQTGDTPLVDHLKVYIKEKYNKPGKVFLGVVHRLDRPTSGVVVMARTSKALQRMNRLFADREVEKKYWAWIEKGFQQHPITLEHWLIRNSKQNKSWAYDKELPDSKKAILHLSIKHQLDRYNLVEIELETGRHHQIRSQLSKVGYPIKGDLKYGAKRSNPDGGIDLHARQLSFIHPVSNKKLIFCAPVPKGPLWQAVPFD